MLGVAGGSCITCPNNNLQIKLRKKRRKKQDKQ